MLAIILTPSAWALQDIVTESNQFDLVGFIPLLRERIYSNNQYARQFIISWVGTRVPCVPTSLNSRTLCPISFPCPGKLQISTAMCELRHMDLFGQVFKLAEFFTCCFKRPTPCHLVIAVAGIWHCASANLSRTLHTKLESTIKVLLV